MVLVIKYNHIYKAQWPVDVTRFQVKSRNKSRRSGDSVDGGRIQHIEIFHKQSKFWWKVKINLAGKSRYSLKSAVEKGMWEINPHLQVQKSGVFVFVSVFWIQWAVLETLCLSMFSYRYGHWSGVIVFVFSYGLWFIFRGICFYVFAYYMVHGSSPHLQGSVGHGAQGNSIMCRCWWWLYAFPLLLPSLTVPHYMLHNNAEQVQFDKN